VEAIRPVALEISSAAITDYFATKLECERGSSNGKKNAREPRERGGSRATKGRIADLFIDRKRES